MQAEATVTYYQEIWQKQARFWIMHVYGTCRKIVTSEQPKQIIPCRICDKIISAVSHNNLITHVCMKFEAFNSVCSHLISKSR